MWFPASLELEQAKQGVSCMSWIRTDITYGLLCILHQNSYHWTSPKWLSISAASPSKRNLPTMRRLLWWIFNAAGDRRRCWGKSGKPARPAQMVRQPKIKKIKICPSSQWQSTIIWTPTPTTATDSGHDLQWTQQVKRLSPAEVVLPSQAVLAVLRLLAVDPILPCLLFLLLHHLHLLLPLLFVMPPVVGDAGEPGRHRRTGWAEGATCRHILSFSCICLCIYTLFIGNVCKAKWVCADQRIVLYESYLGSNNDLGSRQWE